MTLVTWNPWQEMNTIHRQINRIFGEDMLPSTLIEKSFAKVPAAELHETEDAVQLKLELPGIEAKDLDVQVTEKAVYVNGERKSETKT